MSKKVFYQTSILLLFVLLFFIAALVGTIYGVFILISYDNYIYRYVGSIAGVCLAIYFVYTIIRFSRNRIVFNNEFIFVPGNWGKGEAKLQYECKIAYSEIKNIFIAKSDDNSLNKPIKFALLPMPYIVFEYANGEQKAINVFYYSKKSVIKIIDEAIKRAKLCGNTIEIGSGESLFNDFLLRANKQ